MIRYLNETFTYKIRVTSEKNFIQELKEIEEKVKNTQVDKKDNLILKGEARVTEIVDIKYTPLAIMNGESALVLIEDVTYYTQKRFDEIFTK